jgi:hypothetical protein
MILSLDQLEIDLTEVFEEEADDEDEKNKNGVTSFLGFLGQSEINKGVGLFERHTPLNTLINNSLYV